jgi:hypothetical protein
MKKSRGLRANGWVGKAGPLLLLLLLFGDGNIPLKGGKGGRKQ